MLIISNDHNKTWIKLNPKKYCLKSKQRTDIKYKVFFQSHWTLKIWEKIAEESKFGDLSFCLVLEERYKTRKCWEFINIVFWESTRQGEIDDKASESESQIIKPIDEKKVGSQTKNGI